MRKLSIILCIIIVLFLHSWLEASVYLPIYKGTFWIKRLANPDEIILTPSQIEKLNNTIVDNNDQMVKIADMEDIISKEKLTNWLLEDPLLIDKKMFDRKGQAIKKSFYKKLLDNMNMETVKESNTPIFGVITEKTDIRAFPTDASVLKSPQASGFDTFQYSAIYPPQPAALLHTTKDAKWGFFQTNFVRGWIKMDKIAFVKSKEEIMGNTATYKSLIITGSRVKVFKERGKGQGAMGKEKSIIGIVPMGTNFVLQGEDKNYWIIQFPQKGGDRLLNWISAYIEKKADAHIGPLAYTKRNAINQAFKVLGEKYGWGGKDGLRDCSSFVQDVFATMGINLPRHSGQQAAVGTVLASIEESLAGETTKTAMDSAVPGITLFGFNGHIMLYLGKINDSYYTLHQLFGYYDKDGFKTVNKTVVTNLDLGKGSKMGTIKERVKSVNIISLNTAQ